MYRPYVFYDAPQQLSSYGLNEEMEAHPDLTWELGEAGHLTEDGTLDNAGRIQVAYCVELGRAGISWGADPDWTDAIGVEDALDRYFAVDDAAMCN